MSKPTRCAMLFLTETRFKKIALGLVTSTLLLIGGGYALGQWWLPGFVQKELAQFGLQKFGRQLSLGDFSFNPFRLKASLRDLKLYGADKKTVEAEIAGIEINLSSQSLWRLALIIEALQIQRPRLDVVRYASGKFNLSDLLERLLRQPSRPTPAFAISNFSIQQGELHYRDLEKSVQHQISELTIAVPLIANFPHVAPIRITPAVSGKFNHEPFSLKGEAIPFGETPQANLQVRFDEFELAPILRGIALPWPFELSSGNASGQLNLAFAQSKSAHTKTAVQGAPVTQIEPAFLLSGQVNLSNLQLRRKSLDKNTPATPMVVDKLALRLDKIDLLQQQAKLTASLESKTLGGWWNEVIRPYLHAQLVEGQGKLQAQLTANWQAAPQVSLQHGSIELEEVRLLGPFASAQTPYPAKRDNKTTAALWQFKTLQIEGLSAALDTRTIEIQKIRTTGGQLNLTRAADGQFNWQKIWPGAAPANTPTTASSAPPEPRQPWQIQLSQLDLDGYAIEFLDQTSPQPAPLKLSPFRLQLQNLKLNPATSLPASAPAKLEISSGINPGGHLKISGEIQLPHPQQKLATKLDLAIDGLSLPALRGYVDDYFDLILTQGELFAHGQLKLSTGNQGMNLDYTGDAALKQILALDSAQEQDLFKWRNFAAQNLHLALSENSNSAPRVVIDKLVLDDFYARLVIGVDGKLNLRKLLKRQNMQQDALRVGPNNSPESALFRTPALPPTTPASQPATLIRLGGITLNNGQIYFTDNFIRPRYTANLTQLNGSISSVASDSTVPANLEIKGKVDDEAPLIIAGTLQPLGPSLFADIRAQARGIEMPKLSPYATKYVGYPITKGKLSVELQYKINQGQLTADNRVILDKLTFGDKVESPSATKLPVLLAVALLKNRQGEIEIDLPISGSLNDPEFKVSSVIWQVFGNLISKAVTAPFTLLGSLFGGGEELSFIEFANGYHKLNADAQKKLESLAKALRERSSLTLDISGTAQPSDLAGLRQAMLQERLLAQKIRQLAAAGLAINPEQVQISAQEYPALLERVYRDTAQSRNLPAPNTSLTLVEMEKILLAQIKIDSNALYDLANRRAATVRDWLANQQISLDRLFIVAPKIIEEAQATTLPRVEFSLHEF